MFESGPAVGVHELVIESSRHVASISEQSPQEVAWVFQAYRDRMQAARRTAHVVHALVLKNARPAAGASLEHVHSQLTGLPMVPAAAREKLHGARRYYRRHRRCVFCDMIRQEQQAASRVIDGSEDFIALCPFASRFAYEMWVLPTEHASHFDQVPTDQLPQLGQLVRRCVARMEDRAGQPAYNYMVHSAPFDTGTLDHYHWHIEILPRISKAGGFEWGTGFHINSVPPEEAAWKLRNANYA